MVGTQKPLQFVKSLYTDPFKWSVVKSVSIFIAAVYIAREMAVAEKTAQLVPGTS